MVKAHQGDEMKNGGGNTKRDQNPSYPSDAARERRIKQYSAYNKDLGTRVISSDLTSTIAKGIIPVAIVNEAKAAARAFATSVAKKKANRSA